MPTDPHSSTTNPMTDGTIEKRDGGYVLRYERHLDHPLERVWAALTEPDQLVQWLADADLDLVEGGAFELRWLNTDDEGNRAVMRGTITRLQPVRLIEYSGDVHGVLRWELRPDGDGSLLTFVNGTPAPEEYRAKVLAGWHTHLDHLADALDGHPVDWMRWGEDHRPRWGELHDRYAARLAS